MRRVCPSVVFIFLISISISVPAAAQTCLGRASFDAAPLQVSGGAAFTDGANGFEAGFAGGTSRLFAGATLGRTNLTEIDESATEVGGFVGIGGPAPAGRGLHLCGLAGVNYTAGPSFGVIDTDAVSFGVGASVGVVAVEAPGYSIVPVFGGAVSVTRVTASAGGEDESETETSGRIDAGVGLIFNRRVSVTPRVGFPVGRDSNDPVFSITLGVNFGR